MKVLLAIALSFVLSASFGQDVEKQKAAIDAVVERISKLKEAKTESFTIQAKKKVLHDISYQYLEGAGGYVKISRSFSHKNDSIHQEFYLKGGSLIYANETIVSYFTGNGTNDSIAWSGGFYFANGKLIDHISLGHGKSEEESWDPEKEMLMAFNEAKRDVGRYKRNK